MTKLMICILAILFMAAAVTASSFRTTITIAGNPMGEVSQRCEQQFQRAQNLRTCDDYLRQSSKFPEEIMLINQQGGDWRQSFPRCCEELEQMEEEECRCEGLTQIIHQEQQAAELQGRERAEAFQTAQALPGLCRIPPRHCSIPSLS
ncbi:2S seed storage albumin protein [Capsicum chacoense]